MYRNGQNAAMGLPGPRRWLDGGRKPGLATGFLVKNPLILGAKRSESEIDAKDSLRESEEENRRVVEQQKQRFAGEVFLRVELPCRWSSARLTDR